MRGEYLVTFYTHYNALVCLRGFENNELKQNGSLTVKLIPVPRAVSSSCGTALKLEFNDKELFKPSFLSSFEHEAVFEVTGNGAFIML